MKRLLVISLWTLAASAMLAGCPYHQPIYLINHRDQAVQVVYRYETYYLPEKRYGSCRWDEYQPAVFRGTDVDIRSAPKEDAAYVYDRAACEIRLTLPPKSTAYIAANDFCSDDTEDFKRTDILPTIKYLRIETDAGAVEYSGWEVARVLEEHGGLFSHGDCRYEIR
jgi:hypothetical protein